MARLIGACYGLHAWSYKSKLLAPMRHSPSLLSEVRPAKGDKPKKQTGPRDDRFTGDFR